jgi:abequosyltransferase
MESGVLGRDARDDVSLSFCIPTYNRGPFIGATLNSILQQTTRTDIEIVVYDGGSDDDTEAVVEGIASLDYRVRYVRSDRNCGVDRDMANAVAASVGAYCWLMSSDDILLCDTLLCTKDMLPIRRARYLKSRDGAAVVFRLDGPESLRGYFLAARGNGALFCYMSVCGFRRGAWGDQDASSEFAGSGYAHVHRLLGTLRRGCSLLYIPQPLIWNRADNDYASTLGIEKRYLLDFDGYLRLAEDLFGDHQILRAEFLRVMTREHPWYRLLRFRASVSDPESWNAMTDKLSAFGYHPKMLQAIGVVGGRCRPLVELAVEARRAGNRLHARANRLVSRMRMPNSKTMP